MGSIDHFTLDWPQPWGSYSPSKTVRSFVAVQIPILDLRSIAQYGNAKLLRPDWPDPIPGVEFIRSVGGVKKRPAGPIYGWDGEIAFCEARRFVKFKNSLSTASHSFNVVYRRLFGFEYGYRLDFGFVAYSSPMRTWKEVAEETLSLQVVVDNSEPRELRSIGPDLAYKLSRLTTPGASQSDFSTPDLVAGVPAIRVESPLDRRRLEAAVESDRIPRYRLVGSRERLRSERRLRGALWRLHTELEFLRTLNRAIRQNGEAVDVSKATALISELTSHLAQERRDGVAQPPLIALAAAFGELELQELLSLADVVRNQSLGLARRLEITAERAVREMAIKKLAESAAGINIDIFLQVHTKEIIMGDKIKANKKAVVNSKSVVLGSFNRIASKDPDLHQALTEILDHVDRLQEPALRAEAKELATSMVEAADAGKRSVFRASWDRLREIAPMVGAGAGVATAVARFLG